ncbi:GEVED domain-containing protein [Stieleria sp. ICT_E10.1]|uniref:Calx-beta domain-containing protein n=1 Tax=Stieleria sedimenti TaxID=2976331 RepID=UPI002180720C|nr:Calx-beta domain-containing protein [Stieleria sedimenti]MCS7469113.1 GEVED domain-containing protein [Stieleria sedimenti]
MFRIRRTSQFKPSNTRRRRRLAAGLQTLEKRHLLAAAVLASPFPPTIDFADFSDASDLTLVADTTATAERLRLTTATLDVGGAAWHHDKQYVSIGFETTFQFQMSEGNDGENGGGAGFAFVIQNNPAPVAKASHLGYHQAANNLAIEFDTVQEASLNDPSDSHVSVHSRGPARNHWNENFSLGSFNTSGFRLDDGSVHTAKVTYAPGTMEVYLDDLATAQLVIPLDLEELLDLDHGRATVGFTASAGGGIQNHDILSWTFANTEDTSSTLSILDSGVIEGDSGSVNLDLTLQRLGDVSASATVAWSTVADTATAGSDYATSQGLVVFLPSETEKTISVPVFGDTEEETNETVHVSIQVTEGTLAVVDGTAVGSILNDDVNISVADVTVTEGDQQYGFIDSAVDTTAVSINAIRKAIIRPDGYLYLNSEVPAEILRYDADTGVFIDRFATMPNSEQATFRDFNFGPDGDLYVIDRKPGYRVLRFDGTSGAYRGEFVASRSGGLDSPKTFVFDSDGNLYVASHGDKVLKYQGPFGTEPGAFLGEFVSGSGRPDTPDNLTFGPNGDLFVGYSNTVDRYNGTTGASLGTFVQPGSGGLNRLFQGGLIFGPDRNGDAQTDLYVTSGSTDEVLVYDGSDGSYIEPLFSAGLGGLDLPAGLTFDDDGNLLVGKVGGDDDLMRYGIQSQAVFIVSLSKPSGVPVTVQYTTADGTAKSGDYTPVSGTLTFPPGVTSRTITVPTHDDATFESDETFQLTLSNAVGATIVDDTGVATILNDDIPPLDFGDAPASYGTLIDNDGAVHIAVGPRLGAHRDSEDDGFPSVDADGDDVDGSTDDEDGVLFGTLKLGQTMAGVNIDLQGSGEARIDAWIDFDADGVWDASEKLLDSASVTSGLQTLNFSVPATMTLGQTYARVRVSTAGGLGPAGFAEDGEVEDYSITIREDVVYVAQPSENDITVSLAGANVELIDNDSGAALLTKPITTTQSIQLTGTTGDDRFVIDYDEGGFYTLPDGMEIDAAGGSDSVVIRGTGTSTATLRSPDGTLAGAIVQVNDASYVNEVRLVDVGPTSVHAMQSIEIAGSLNVADQVLSLAATNSITLGTMTEFAGGRIEATGPVTVDGVLKYRPPAGVTPAAGDSFVLLTATTLDGSFTSLDLPTPPLGSDWDLKVDATEVRLTLVDLAEVDVLTLGSGAGATQRSNVTNVRVTFDGLVDIEADAFELRKHGTEDGLVTTAFTLATDTRNNSVAALTFSGPHTRGASAALEDGNYQLTIDPTKVHRAGTSIALDGDGDGLQGGTYAFGTTATDQFFAFFGDTDGDRDVDGQDYGRFGLTFLKSAGTPGFNSDLDSDGDGDVDGQDYGRFGLRFLKQI